MLTAIALPAWNILLGSQHLQTAGCGPNPLIHCRVLRAPKDLTDPSDPCFFQRVEGPRELQSWVVMV